MDVSTWLKTTSLLALNVPLLAFAALGGNVESIASDQMRMKAAKRGVDAAEGFTVHQLQAPSGTMIKEFAGPDGRVFAVAWQGPSQPDLRQLLGNYFEVYREAARSEQAGHRRLMVRQPDLVVRSGGHMRAFSGMAYVPSLLPQGVRLEQLQ